MCARIKHRHDDSEDTAEPTISSEKMSVAEIANTVYGAAEYQPQRPGAESSFS